jgi:hypothetical protein
MLPTEKMMYASENMPRPGRPKEMYLAMGSVRKDRYWSARSGPQEAPTGVLMD